jgi:hypothetical protein
VLSGTRRIGETRDPTPFLISLKYVSEELQIFQKKWECFRTFRRNQNVSEEILPEKISSETFECFRRSPSANIDGFSVAHVLPSVNSTADADIISSYIYMFKY